MTIPDEVKEAVNAYLGYDVPDGEGMLQWAPKSVPRCVAWNRCPQPKSNGRGLRDYQTNPWRKCHTQNYWVWYHVDAEPFILGDSL